MESWWTELLLEKQIFYGIGILALVVLAIQMILLLFVGMDDGSGVGDVTEHGSGLSILSVRSVTAFFMGFGWAGVIALNSGLGLGLAIIIGLVVGGALMLGIFLLMTSFMKLQSSGSLIYANAVGAIATVYVTIPPAQAPGGQIEVLIQGRLSMADALQRGPTTLAPGTKVRVAETIGASTFLVTPLDT